MCIHAYHRQAVWTLHTAKQSYSSSRRAQCGCFSTPVTTTRIQIWLRCVQEPRWDQGPESAEPGFHPLADPGKCWAAVMKQHLKMGLFHREILTALTCFAGSPALCQAGESSDAAQPNPPNIKGSEAVPMGLVLLSGRRNLASELPFEEHRQRGAAGAPAAPRRDQLAQPSQASSSPQYKPTGLKMTAKNPLQT